MSQATIQSVLSSGARGRAARGGRGTAAGASGGASGGGGSGAAAGVTSAQSVSESAAASTADRAGPAARAAGASGAASGSGSGNQNAAGSASARAAALGAAAAGRAGSARGGPAAQLRAAQRAALKKQSAGGAPLWLGGLGLGIGFGCGALAAQAPEPWMQIGLMSAAAAFGGFGLFVGLERILNWAGAEPAQVLKQFERFYAASPEPTALIDATGRIRAMNKAGRAAAEARARRAADLLPPGPHREAAVARLLRETLQDRAATESFEHAHPRRARRGGEAQQRSYVEVSVWPVGRGMAVWRWRPDHAAAADPLAAAASVGWFRIDAKGRLVGASRRFRDWLVGSGAAGPDGRIEPQAARELSAVDLAAAFPDLGRRFLAESRGATLARTRFRGAGAGPKTVSLVLAPLRDGEGRIGVVAPAPRTATSASEGVDATPDALDGLAAALLFEESPIGLAILSTDARVMRVNAVADRLLSGSDHAMADAVVGKSLAELLAEDDRDDALRRLAEVSGPNADGAGWMETNGFDARLAPADEGEETERAAEFHVTRVDGPRGPVLLCYVIDASERHAFESRFIQTQKLQAVGQLAGGVAHDFNNLLQVITGVGEELLLRRTQDDPDFGELNQIYQNAHRAAALVSQLLAFSRKQTLRPQVVNLTERMSDLAHLLNRLIGEKVVLRQELAEDIWDTRVDVNQCEQVVTNLVVNARDAMPDGGGVTLRTKNMVYAPTEDDNPYPMPAGDYVSIEVEDDGCGIPKDKQDKIFEPFYTTKGVGEGTGLGLSTVYGIIKQTGGFIFVESEVGVGTIFRIFLRRHWDVPGESASVPEPAVAAPPPPPEFQRRSYDAAPAPLPVAAGEHSAPQDGATILLVEDEDPVRALAARSLRGRGYTVYEATCGEEALEMLSDPSFEVDLLLSDVVMPNMDGPTLLSRIGPDRPELRTLFMSGYARDAFSGVYAADLKGRGGYGFLQKPFSLSGLAEAVREQIDR